MAIQGENQRLHPARKIIALVLAIVLISIAWTLYARNHHAPAPAQSTNQSNPNSSRNTPPGGSVTQGGDPSQDTTPNPNGTGNNTTLSQ
jgi:hypothetical protein